MRLRDARWAGIRWLSASRFCRRIELGAALASLRAARVAAAATADARAHRRRAALRRGLAAAALSARDTALHARRAHTATAALEGRRLRGAFGELRRARLPSPPRTPPPTAPSEWTTPGSVASLATLPPEAAHVIDGAPLAAPEGRRGRFSWTSPLEAAPEGRLGRWSWRTTT